MLDLQIAQNDGIEFKEIYIRDWQVTMKWL